MDFFLHLAVMASIYVIFALSLNIQVGYTGLFNFGHAAFFGIGAYTSAILSLHHVPFVWALLAAVVVSGACGLLLSLPSLRLAGDHFGIATLGFGEIIRMIFQNESWLTRGPLGLPGIPKPALFAYRFDSLTQYLLLAAGFALITFFVLRVIVESPFGRALRAIRDDEVAAMVLGKDVRSFKRRSFVTGCALAAVAGVLWAHYTTFISPSDFTLLETILVLLMVVLGGKGTQLGPVVGAIVLIFFQESLRFLRLPAELTRYLAPLQQMIFGALLVALTIFRPEGIVREKGARPRAQG